MRERNAAILAKAFPFDLFHTINFPNNIRNLRRLRGYRRLLDFGPLVAQIPYVRLSKIERGEVVARVEELVQVASVLDVNPHELLIDVASPEFDMVEWASEQVNLVDIDLVEEELAVLLGAALRYQRANDRTLTPSRLESHFHLTPAVVSRLENGLKSLSRWNSSVQMALCRVFEVSDLEALAIQIRKLYADNKLEPYLSDIRNVEQRQARTEQVIETLRSGLNSLNAPWSQAAADEPTIGVADFANSGNAFLNRMQNEPTALATIGAQLEQQPIFNDLVNNVGRRLVPVFGSALADGLVARTPTNGSVEVPFSAGPHVWAMRVCWQSLGAGLPGRAVLIIDPDRFPATGGLSVIREQTGYRLLAVKTDRQGRLRGYSDYPARDILIDELLPADVGTVISAVFE